MRLLVPLGRKEKKAYFTGLPFCAGIVCQGKDKPGWGEGGWAEGRLSSLFITWTQLLELQPGTEDKGETTVITLF